MVELAVAIVTWNVRGLALDALRSLYADLEAHGPEAEVYVVDSASTDGTPDVIAQRFPQVRLIVSETNLGFGASNNVAMRAMGFGQDNVPEASLPCAVYLLNPDTITHPGATRTLYDALMSNPEAGLVGAQLLYDDGSLQHGAFAFPGLRQLWVEFFPIPGRLVQSRFNGRYPQEWYRQDKPFPVDFTLGATMMLRREVIRQTGMFDESFFMYAEEVDWAWRIHQAGWKVLCVPGARVTHLSGKSTSQVRPESVANLWSSRLRLYTKHYPAWKRFLAREMVVRGMRRRIKQMQEAPDLSPADRGAMIEAYHTVIRLARES